MEIINATRLVAPAPDSQYRLRPCDCGNNQPVYMVGCDGLWRVLCLECKHETKGFTVQHEAQVAWNKNARGEDYGRDNRQIAAETLQRVPVQKACVF